MKALFIAGLAAGLAGFSLQAQEPPTVPASARGPSGQTAADPSAQQLLQMVTDLQRPAPPDAGPRPPDEQTPTSLVRQIVRLATLEITQLQQKLQEDDTGSPGVAKEAAPAPADAPGTAAPVLGDAAFSVFAHAWDTALSAGGLRTGGLQTGHLAMGHLTTGSTANAASPARNFIVGTSTLPVAAGNAAPNVPPVPPNPPAVVNAPPANAPAALNNAPPADPDDEMLRWSRRIDRQYATEQAARGAALRLYPALAVAHSEFNAQFLARYAQYRQADPFGFLRGPGWPVKLAIFTAGDLRRRGVSTVF